MTLVGAPMRRFAQWLRRNGEHYLIESVQTELARRYLGRPGGAGDSGPAAFFWRRVFVPVYRRLPWRFRRALIQAMPGSHRRSWHWTPTRPHHPP